MELSFEKKNDIGFQYVMDLLQPCSCYGSAYIRKLKPYGSDSISDLRTELDNIEKMLLCSPEIGGLTAKLQQSFMHLKDIKPIVSRCEKTALNDVELFEIKRFLLICRDIYPLISQLIEITHIECIAVKDLAAALRVVDPDGTGVLSFYISESCSDELREIRREKKRIEMLIRADGGNKDILTADRTAIAAREEEAELAVKKAMSDDLRPFLSDMLLNVEMICRLDVMLAKVQLAQQHSTCKPEIADGQICFENMINPKISDGLEQKGKAFTPVSLSLERGATVITGANMGGKSVAIKTAALNVVLSLCGIYPFAEKAIVPPLDNVFIISEDLESVDSGLSSFGGEITEFNKFAGMLDDRSLLMLDEFARGTNPDEGAAIVRATTKWLQKKESYSVIATHYDGVAECAGAHYQVIGLRDICYKAVRAELLASNMVNGADRIAEHMNYGLYRVDNDKDCPKDALNICKLLDMESEIVELAEADITG